MEITHHSKTLLWERLISQRPKIGDKGHGSRGGEPSFSGIRNKVGLRKDSTKLNLFVLSCAKVA